MIKKRCLTEINYPNGYREICIRDDIEHENKKGGRKGKKAKEVSYKDKEQKIYRNKKAIRRLMILNDTTRLMTLTTRENIKDHEKIDKYFKKFIYELKQIYTPAKKLKYIGTRERQERGAIHYHFAINMFIPQEIAEEVWLKIVKSGSVNLEYIGMKAINYVCKYIEKNMINNEFINQSGYSAKAYLNSKNLDRDYKKYSKKYSYIIIREKNKEKVIGDYQIVDIINQEIEESKEKGLLIWDNTSEYEVKGQKKECRNILLRVV